MRTKKTVASKPFLSANKQNVVVSVGDPVSKEATETVYALTESQPHISDKVVVSKIIGHLLYVLSEGRWLSPSPTLLIQLDFDGFRKLTTEMKADLEEIGEWCGARRTVVRLGRKLSDARAFELAD